jgi:hypothetical protein
VHSAILIEIFRFEKEAKMGELKLDERMSDEFKHLIDGMDIPCDLVVPKTPPVWLDQDAFFRGQKYFLDNTCPIFASCLRNLITGLFIQNLWY